MKIIVWTNEEATHELKKRLEWAKQKRDMVESMWDESERTVYNSYGTGTKSRYDTQDRSGIGLPDVDNGQSDIDVSYAFKNLRFIHAQLSANPPTVVPRPATNDQEDRRRADSADRLVRYAIRQYKMQEIIDQSALDTLIYGSGFMKGVWDSTTGDIIELDEETGEMELEGDLRFTIPSPWSMFIDPDAGQWDDVRYVFEKIYMPYEDAISRFGADKKDIIDQNRYEAGTGASYEDNGSRSALDDSKYNAVELYEYWEPGLPVNGFLGRHTVCTKNGELLQEVGPSPHRFLPMGQAQLIRKNEELSPEEIEAKISKLPKKAALPYHIFTDIDVPHLIWGKSFLEYVTPLQEILNRLDGAMLDNIQAHGAVRMVLPEGTEIPDDGITNTPWDIVKMTGTQPPHFIQPAPTMPDSNTMRDRVKQGIDDISGVNESMFGQQSREQSGFSMQYATNQGNMIRRRLFNKYVLFVESIYKNYLNLVRKHWDIPRTIQVLGNEKALQTIDIKGADIDGGWDLVVEYGASLSLDPMTRREEIMTMQPLFKEAGIPPRVSLQMMKLNELEGLYDMMQLSEDRQREIFERMIATDEYISPEELQDHESMIAYGKRWIMTREFESISPEHKLLVKKHIKDRAAKAAEEAAPAAGPAGAAPPVPPQGALPQDAEMVGEQADTEQLPPIING